MKILLSILILAVGFLAAGCTDAKLPREEPSSPAESYEVLPK
ncbi:MAG: hypothetical protein R3B41_01870 [Candidatus Doudnabacteria bacterium]